MNMIASLHPCITKDLNILCAGRSLTDREKNKLAGARAVIVPQGVTAEVYRECRRLVPHIFPYYDLRFPLEGKIGDALLFQCYQRPHPKTLIFKNHQALFRVYPEAVSLAAHLSGFPLVLKADRGGEGAFVFLVSSQEELMEKLSLIPPGEGFILQEKIDHGGRDLRVVVLFDTFYAYWRVQPDPELFLTNQSQGAQIVHQGDDPLKQRAIAAVQGFCRQTGINLAGFDILFSRNKNPGTPLFLEINYYFGRKGLGGSLRFYDLLQGAVDRWLATLEP
jgi:ribosomal protein S6--L-glutamate ligase